MTKKRVPISKKIRFEVFKRDGFRCVYCGKTPEQSPLEVDHIDPHSKGGSDDINNLVTACFDCNRGKTNIPLEKIPAQISENAEVLVEREEQIKEYRKIIKKVERRQKRDIKAITDLYTFYFPGWHLTDSFINISLKRFMGFMAQHELEEAMRIAGCKFLSDSENQQYIGEQGRKAISYFCGICWRRADALGLRPKHR